MKGIRLSTPLANYLIARGLIPQECRLLELIIPAHDVIVLRYEVMLTDETAKIIAEGLAALAAGEDGIEGGNR